MRASTLSPRSHRLQFRHEHRSSGTVGRSRTAAAVGSRPVDVVVNVNAAKAGTDAAITAADDAIVVCVVVVVVDVVFVGRG